MVQFNFSERTIKAKVVYYGPAQSGKTTNLEQVHVLTDPSGQNRLISLNTSQDRTLFFDLLPFSLGSVSGYDFQVQLYTVPGQVYYNASRRLILKGVDGLVFVADSQASRAEANIESMHNLFENLETYGYDLGSIPFAIQYNKRDMPNVLAPEELRAQINPMGVPDFEGVAITGTGVFETLSCVSRLVVETLS